MKFVEVCLSEKMENYISQEKINGIQLYFKEDLKRVLCCGKYISDGCQIILWSSDIVEICHNCFIEFFDEMLTITHQDKTKDRKYYTIKLPNYSFQLSNSSLYILRSKMNYYFKGLYKKHIRDDLFIKSDSFYVQKFLEKTRRVVNETEKASRQTSRMSAGKRKLYFNEKNITDDISQCYKYPFTISLPPETKKIEPLFDLEVYTVFSNIQCRINHHDKYSEAVTVVSDGRDYGFTFSFCAEHLYDFAMLLKQVYFDYQINKFEIGDFRIEKGYFGSPCYLTKCKHRTMYKLHINQCSVILAREGLLMLAEKILTSSAFSELYPIEAKQFLSLRNDNEIKENEKLKEYLSREKQARRDEIESLTAFYEKAIENLKNEITELSATNKELNSAKTQLEYELNHIDKIILQQRAEVKARYQKRILNCLDLNKTDITLGIKAKTAKQYKERYFKVTYINGIKCSTFPHYFRRETIAIIETHRTDDKFCLAVCEDCIDIYLLGLKEARVDKPYINENMHFSVIVNSNPNNPHCYLCGSKSQTKYIIKHGYIKYFLCPESKKKLETTLEEVKRNLSYIRLLGGKDFITNIENF